VVHSILAIWIASLSDISFASYANVDFEISIVPNTWLSCSKKGLPFACMPSNVISLELVLKNSASFFS
jgi:hypothetical protein